MFAQAKYQPAFLINRSMTQNILIVLLASVVLSLISKIFLPWKPIPMTFESATVILFGLTLGSKRAVCAVGLYLLQGSLGVWPSGFSVLMGPSAGFVFAFLPAAFFAGCVMEKGMASSFIRIFATAIASTVIVFLGGVLWLQAIVGWKDAYVFGVQPFLLVEPAKLIVVSLIARSCFKKSVYNAKA